MQGCVQYQHLPGGVAYCCVAVLHCVAMLYSARDKRHTAARWSALKSAALAQLSGVSCMAACTLLLRTACSSSASGFQATRVPIWRLSMLLLLRRVWRPVTGLTVCCSFLVLFAIIPCHCGLQATAIATAAGHAAVAAAVTAQFLGVAPLYDVVPWLGALQQLGILSCCSTPAAAAASAAHMCRHQRQCWKQAPSVVDTVVAWNGCMQAAAGYRHPRSNPNNGISLDAGSYILHIIRFKVQHMGFYCFITRCSSPGFPPALQLL